MWGEKQDNFEGDSHGQRAYDEYAMRFGAIPKDAARSMYIEWFSVIPLDELIDTFESIKSRGQIKRPMLDEIQQSYRIWKTPQQTVTKRILDCTFCCNHGYGWAVSVMRKDRTGNDIWHFVHRSESLEKSIVEQLPCGCVYGARWYNTGDKAVAAIGDSVAVRKLKNQIDDGIAAMPYFHSTKEAA